MTFLYFFRTKYDKIPKNTTADVACPLGKEKSVAVKKLLMGLGILNNSFTISTISASASIVIDKNIASFFRCFINKKIDISIEIITMLVVSKIISIFFENIIKKLLVTEENKEFTYKFRFVIILYLTQIKVRIKSIKDTTFIQINFFEVFI